LLVAALGLCACKDRRPAPRSQPHRPQDRPLTAAIRLADWKMRYPGQVGYVSVSVVHHRSGGDELRVLDVRRKRPRVYRPRGARRLAPLLGRGLYIIHRLDLGPRNVFGGYFGTYAREPSRAEAELEPGPDGLQALSLSYDNRERGFSGLYFHLFDTKAPPDERVYLDARRVPYLTFAIRGARGGERFLLRVADQHWERAGDSFTLGRLDKFLPRRRITTRWQHAWIPLDRVKRPVNRSELASVVLAVDGSHWGKVYLRDMALASAVGVKLPPPTRSLPPARRLRRGLWLWQTARVVASPAGVRSAADFCRRRGITDVFLQVPYSISRVDGRWSVAWKPRRLRPLLAALHRAGARVDALTGDPRMALKDQHGRPLAVARAVIAHNRKSPERERFDGLRFDIEPYLLPQFEGVHKQSILRQYRSLLQKAGALGRKAGLTLGADIPFWFDELNRYYEPTAELEGRPFSEHVLDAVDNISIMDYRTTAYGPDGVLAHAEGELEYATRQGKQVFIGLETVDLPDETQYEYATQRNHNGGSLLIVRPDGKGRARVTWDPVSGRPPGGAARVLRPFHKVPVRASRVTFARLGLPRMERIQRLTHRELVHSPAFAGFALHAYTSFRKLTLK
jgi:hypothetical protein